MPKLKCHCGYIHDLSPIPDDGWVIIKARDHESYLSALVQHHGFIDGRFPIGDDSTVEEQNEALMKLNDLEGRLYDCPKCGGLLVQKPKSDNYIFYGRTYP